MGFLRAARGCTQQWMLLEERSTTLNEAEEELVEAPKRAEQGPITEVPVGRLGHGRQGLTTPHRVKKLASSAGQHYAVPGKKRRKLQQIHLARKEKAALEVEAPQTS